MSSQLQHNVLDYRWYRNYFPLLLKTQELFCIQPSNIDTLFILHDFIMPTTQEKTLYMDITRWSTLKSDSLYSLQPNMEKLDTVSKNKTGS